MTEYSYVVTVLTGGPIDISEDIEEIECIDTGTGEVKSAKIRLNSIEGKYITAAPLMTQFVQIKIKITDEDSVDYEQIYEVDRVIPIKNAAEGYTVELELMGQEQHLQKKDIAKQFYFTSAQETAEGIIDFYNDDLGTAQPTVINHDVTTSGNNELPVWTANNYEFGLSEIKAYDALLEVVEGLGASVAGGGAGDFYELYFDSDTADPTQIKFKAFVSGSSPAGGSEVTITDSTSVNEAPTEGGLHAITGTLVKAWGKINIGTLPNSIQNFAGELEAFRLHPQHASGVTYPANARVQLAGTHYQANVQTSNTPPHANWTSKTFADIQGAANGYSLWTDGKIDEWQSSGSDPSTANKGKGYWDSNMNIEDGIYTQRWVIKRVNTDVTGVGSGQIPSNYKYSGTDLYRGFRVLVDPNIGTISGVFAENSGNDRFGKAYSNNIVQHNGGTAGDYTDWDVILETADLNRVAVRDEGKVYERQSGTWTDISGVARENHCFHLVSSVANVTGYNSTSDDTTTFGDGSAVEFTWSYTALNAIPAGFFTTDGFYQIGAWANFSFPFPENSYFSNTIGELYGNNATKKEPVTLDSNNMHLSHSGNVGFNHTEAEDLGPINGIQFQMKFQWKDVTSALTLQGNFKMRCTMYDTNDNVVIQDFTIPFNDQWAQIHLPFSEFSPYRARIPLSLGNIAPNLFTRDLEILNTFQWKNIKLICFQWQEVYDDQGRYAPEGSRAIWGAAAGTATIKLAIDAFCFTKPLLAVTAPVTTRVIEPRSLQFPDISNSVQLSQIVNSQLEIEKFRHKEFIITTQGKNDISFGDTFFLTDSKIVVDDDTRTADSGGTANTIRLVAKRIIRKITKRQTSGAGSFLRTIIGIKRTIT